MKVLGLFILTITMLYNTKVHASVTEHSDELFARTEAHIIQTQFNTLRPLRDITGNMNKFTETVKLFNEFRDYDIQLANELLKKIENRSTFSGDDLYQIKTTFRLLIKLNQKVLEAGKMYEYKKVEMADTYSQLNIQNPMARAHLIYLLANVTVFDHMREIYALLFAREGSLRRIIKSTVDDKKTQPLKEVAEQLQTVKDIVENKKFIQQLTLVKSILPQIKEVFQNDNDTLFALDLMLSNNTSKDISEGKTKFEISSFEFVDAVVGFFNKLTNTLSEVFGNIAGSISWRKGFLFDSETAAELLIADLQPMDMLLEKSPFVLTDKFIPGHFGHAALYLGTKEQLEKIGMWNHPDIIPYQEEIEAGKVILEAVRSGVRISTIEAFMNIDEVTVVRKEDALNNPHTLFEQIQRGMDQIGKDYDFNFDISTLDKIVCSELLYIVYGNVHWPTHYRLGRATVTPDDLAEVLFQKNTRFNVKKYIFSTERHRLELASTETLANHFDYELRSENGSPISDRKDPTNSYWKKDTKCYNVSVEQATNGDSYSPPVQVKECKTTYKEFYYEEFGS